jgi:hypothetical protein
MGGKDKKSSKEDMLIGRPFHVFGENGVIDRQGIVLLRVDPERYLVQYLEWSTGRASAQQVVSIVEMTSSPRNSHGPWQWQFYTDEFEMIDWLERNGRKLLVHDEDKSDRKEGGRRQWQWPRHRGPSETGKGVAKEKGK